MIMRTKRDIKGQMKIQEMSFMLLGLVLFFVIAGLFFLVISNAGLKGRAQSASEVKATTTISSLASSPEIGCAGKTLCVDTDKVLALKDRPSFNNFWNVKGGLIIRKTYPTLEGEIECNIGNYDNCNQFTLKEIEQGQGYSGISSFVVLCRKEAIDNYNYDKCELGEIIAYVEQ